MGAETSKHRDRLKAFTASKSSHRKKYLPASTNGSTAHSAVTNGRSGVNGSGQTQCPSIEEPQEELPPFTDRQKELVTETWRMVQEDMAKVGVVMFIK